METDFHDDERRKVRWKARSALLRALSDAGAHAHRNELIKQATRVAGFTQRELEAPPPASAARRYGRLVDHALASALSGLRRETNHLGARKPAGRHSIREQNVDQLDDARTVRDADPGKNESQSALSLAYVKMGDVWKALSNPTEARKSYEDSLTIRLGLAQAFPDDPQLWRDLASAPEGRVRPPFLGPIIAIAGHQVVRERPGDVIAVDR